MLLNSSLDHVSSPPRELDISVLPKQQITMDLLTFVMHLEYAENLRNIYQTHSNCSSFHSSNDMNT
jgi:hypothetical protein